MRISACYIVKNEEKNIARSINSIKEACDEIIIVDTGSTDMTVEIAGKYGTRIEYFEWKEDFAAARNYALSLATGDWIIFLDADEYYCSKINLRGYLERISVLAPKTDAILICLYDYYKKELPPLQVARIFRNDSRIYYQGKIHEVLVKEGGQLDLSLARDLHFMHMGYGDTILKEKMNRNLEMLLAEAHEGGDKDYYIAECYFGLQNYTQALEYIKKALASPIRYFNEEVNYYHILIESMRQCNVPLEEEAQAAREAIANFPKIPEFYGELGIILSAMGELAEAKECLYQCILRYYDNSQKEQGYFTQELMRRICERLARVCLYLSEPVMSEIAWHIAVEMWKLPADDNNFATEITGNYLSKLDEIGMEAYRYSEVNKDSLYWLQLWHHILDLNRTLAILENRQSDVTEEELAQLQMLGDESAVIKATELLRQTRQADAWMLVKLAIERETDILPHEQNVFMEDEQQLWNIYRQLARKKYDIQLAEPPLVSIMLPTYNLPDIFSRTLRSAAIQDYPNMEIIICDNSTDDRSASIAAQYAYDKRIRYIRNTTAKTKEENFAMFEQLAQGEYLQWLMHDDILAPHKVAKMAKVLYENSDIKLVGSQRGIIDEHGNYVKHELEVNWPLAGEGGRFSSPELAEAMLITYSNAIGESSAVLFRRKDLKHHYWHAESRNYKAISDVAMWLELMEQGDVYIFKDKLSYYRRHSRQEGQQKDVILLSRIEWVSLINDYFQRGIFIKDKKNYLRVIRNFVIEYDDFASKKVADTEEMWRRYSDTIEKCRRIVQEMG